MDALIQDLLTFSRAVHTEEMPVGNADLGGFACGSIIGS